MLSADLKDEQVAQLVTDICDISDYDGDGEVIPFYFRNCVHIW